MTAPSPTPAQPSQLDALIALAQQAFHAGRLAEAVAACHKILAIRPIAEVHDYLGVILVQQGQLDAAVAHFRRALALKPAYAQAHVDLADALLSQGNLTASAARSSRRLTLSPDDADVHNSLGIVLAQQGKPDQAAARFEQALALRPNFPEAHNNLGSVLWKQGKLDEAAARYRASLALRPDYAEAHNNLGNVLREQGKLDQAAARFEQALALRPDYADAHNNLGNVLLMPGQARRACGTVTSKRSPSSRTCRCASGPGRLLSGQGDYERGWPAYEARLRMPGACAAAQPSALDGPALGRTQPAARGRARLGGYDPFHPLCPAAEGSGVLGSCWPAQAALGRLLASSSRFGRVVHSRFGPGIAALRFSSASAECPGALGTDALDDSPRSSLPLRPIPS